VLLYHVFSLNLPNVEPLLAERGMLVSDETIHGGGAGRSTFAASCLVNNARGFIHRMDAAMGGTIGRGGTMGASFALGFGISTALPARRQWLSRRCKWLTLPV
jgi:hypothetical protein